jgi:hypothetical protein
MLPVLTSIVVAAKNTFKPLDRWATCKVAARMLQSEIYKFRTRSGVYGRRKHALDSSNNSNTNNHNNNNNNNTAAVSQQQQQQQQNAVVDHITGISGLEPRDIFSKKVTEIWQGLQASEMKLGSLIQKHKRFNWCRKTPNYQKPSSYYVKVIDREYNAMAESKKWFVNIEHELQVVQKKHENKQTIATSTSTKNNITSTQNSFKSNKKFSLFHVFSEIKVNNSDSPVNKNLQQKIDEEIGNITTKSILNIQDNFGDYNDDDYEEKKLEDISTLMSIESYMNTRFFLLLRKYQRRTPILERKLMVLQTLIFLFTGFGSVMSYLTLDMWVPMLMALVAALNGFMDAGQYRIQLMAANHSLLQLEKMQVYWKGLNEIERRRFTFATYIVETVEETVTAELTTYAKAILSNNTPKDNLGSKANMQLQTTNLLNELKNNKSFFKKFI